MDTPQTTCIEWFFGYGGNPLGLSRVIPRLRVIAACEIEAYALANLVAKMEAGALEPFPVWTDCKTFPCETFRGLVDLFVASYPCQGFSQAGQRKGESDPRFLWPFVLRSIAIIQPRRVFLENVEGHVSLGLQRVIGDLEAAGYRVEAGLFSAAECGAPQQRKRIFILGEFADTGHRAGCAEQGQSQNRSEITQATGLGNATHYRGERINRVDTSAKDADAHRGRQQNRKSDGIKPAGAGQELADAECHRGGELHAQHEGRPAKYVDGASSFFWPGFVTRPGEEQHEWEPPRVTAPQRRLGGSVDGRAVAVDTNTDRLRLLGNGVYPACAAKAWVTLIERIERQKGRKP